MLLLNFSHPLTPAQRRQIEALTGREIARLVEIMPQFDEQQPFGPQLAALMAQVPLSPAEWQGEPILVVLPSLNFIAALALAELHGRMGYFPAVVRTRSIAGSMPRQFEVAEIMDLQLTREKMRFLRQEVS